MIPRTRWQRIQSLFEEVVDVPAPERASVLRIPAAATPISSAR